MATLVDSQTTQNDYWTLGRNDEGRYLATSFEAGESYSLTQLDLLLLKSGSPTADVTAYIYSDSSGAPGTLLGTCTTDLDSSTFGTSYGWETFDFSGVSLISSTDYFIVIYSTTEDSSNYVRWGANSSVSGETIQRTTDPIGTWGTVDTSGQSNFRTYKADAGGNNVPQKMNSYRRRRVA